MLVCYLSKEYNYLLGKLDLNCVTVCVSFISQEKDARDIEIPNIKWEVFELMMRYDE
jgi:hypothetical protein